MTRQQREYPECSKCGCLTSQAEGTMCTTCRIRESKESLQRFLAHRGTCWDWVTEDGDLGSGCSELARAIRLLEPIE